MPVMSARGVRHGVCQTAWTAAPRAAYVTPTGARVTVARPRPGASYAIANLASVGALYQLHALPDPAPIDDARAAAGRATGAVPPPTVDVLGVPLALTDYERTMDWMDATIAAARQGLRLRRRDAHRRWPATRTPELRDAVLGAVARRPRRPAARVGDERARRTTSTSRVYGPDLMAALLRARAADRHADVPLRRAQPGRARPARAQPAPALPRPADRRRLLAAVPRARRRGGATRSSPRSTAPAPTSSGSASACPSRRSGWPRCATASTRPCSSASAPRSTSTPASSRRRRPGCSRAGLEWALPPRAGAAPAVAALPALQPALRARVRAPVRARTAGAPRARRAASLRAA